ncbi:hypothetical protein [Sorangium sp. So ce693]|uniref:hypothetical protein n=1 Tax=Sorangium sp. So ce693 TaxID=3133318 RepID=UPI003F60A8E0
MRKHVERRQWAPGGIAWTHGTATDGTERAAHIDQQEQQETNHQARQEFVLFLAFLGRLGGSKSCSRQEVSIRLSLQAGE